MADKKFLRANRKTTRSVITRNYNSISLFPTYNLTKLEVTKTKLERIVADRLNVNNLITQCIFQAGGDNVEASLERESVECEEYETKLDECLYKLTMSINASCPQTNPNANGALQQPPVRNSFLKPPVAPLPTFSSGIEENFEVFLVNFESTLNKYPYTPSDKFLLLRQHVKGKAAFLIDSMDPQAQTYVEAKQLLTSALASRPVQVERILRQLTKMKLGIHDEPFKYMGDMKKIIQSVDTLKIEVKEVLNHFFWRV